jgi:hypothetical protein
VNLLEYDVLFMYLLEFVFDLGNVLYGFVMVQEFDIVDTHVVDSFRDYS